jgi:hypothetical protein
MAKKRHPRTTTKPKTDNRPKKDTTVVKMPKNRRQRGRKAKNNNDAQTNIEPVKPAPGDNITKYGSKEARRALKERGYHPLVTKKSMVMIDKEILKKSFDALCKPSRNDFIAGILPAFRGIYANTNMLITDIEFQSSLHENETSDSISSRVRLFDGRQPPGQLLGELFASQGIKRLQLFAVADPKGFNAMSQGIAIWDFATSGFHGTPCGHVFLCLTPHRSQQSFEQSPAISKLEGESRAQVCRLIASVRNNCGPTDPYWVDDNWRDEEEMQTTAKDDSPEVKRESAKWGRTLVRMIQSLPNTYCLRTKVNKVVDPLPEMHYYMSKQVAAKCIFDLCKSCRILYLPTITQ